MLLRDHDIRLALKNNLSLQSINNQTFDEVSLTYQNIRTDVINFNQQLICGYEIKSDSDTLLRLPHQAESYELLTDKNYLVVGKHLYADSLKIIPDNWGIIKADGINGQVQLTKIKTAKINHTDSFLELFSHCQVPYLRKSISKLLSTVDGKAFRKMNKYEMIPFLENKFQYDLNLKPLVINLLKIGFLSNLKRYK